MPTYNLIESSYNYSKISWILCKYCRHDPALDDNNDIIDFTVANSITNLFKIEEEVVGQTGNNGTANVEIMIPLKYLSNFWRSP